MSRSRDVENLTIVDATVNLDKLAHLGTAGHVLTSTGTGSAPAYEAIPDTNYNLLDSATGSSTLECTSIGSHTHLMISFKVYGNASPPYLHLGTSSGYLADASVGWLVYENITPKTITGATDHAFMLTGNINLSSDNFLAGSIHVFDSGASRPKFLTWTTFSNPGGTYTLFQGGGFTYASQNAITQAKIVDCAAHSSLGNGYLYIYGIN